MYTERDTQTERKLLRQRKTETETDGIPESNRQTDRDQKRRRRETLKLTETSDRQITAFLTPSQP